MALKEVESARVKAAFWLRHDAYLLYGFCVQLNLFNLVKFSETIVQDTFDVFVRAATGLDVEVTSDCESLEYFVTF